MDKFIIKGGKKLKGTISISGAKNATLPIMAATLLGAGRYVLKNVPALRDVYTMASVLEHLGLKIEFNIKKNILVIENKNSKNTVAPYELVRTMRASVLVLGPLLAKLGQAKVSMPGGCAIGARPVDIHLTALREMGADMNIKQGYISAKCNKLKGSNITLDFPSVGATENLIMAAVLAKGKTVISNCAKEPEIIDLINFLNKCGADIRGGGTEKIEITGVKKIKPVEYSIIPDRIEAATFMIAAAMTKSEITLKNVEKSHLDSLITKLEEANVEVRILKNKKIKVVAGNKIKPVNIITMPYPGFPTDIQAQFMALMTLADGSSTIRETVFENRFMHVSEFNRLGAKIKIEGRVAVVDGVSRLSGATIMATDLRASAALVLVGLVAKGKTEILRVYHIDRGYDNIEKKLKSLGADIKRIK